jgi:hypothetical protein
MARGLAWLALLAAVLAACAGEGPPVPSGVTAACTLGGVDVRWSYGSTAGMDCFLIQRSEGGNYNFVDFAKVPPERLYFRDDRVFVGVWYYYRVAAVYAEWNGERGVRSEFSVEAGCQVE